MSKKKLVVKLETVGDNQYSRDKWFGYGPWNASLETDGSLKISVPDTELQICAPAQNDYGTYYMFDIGGGKGFASMYTPKDTSIKPYFRLALGDKVVLPESVMEKVNYKPKGKGVAKAAAPAASADFWAKPELSAASSWSAE